MTEQEQVDALYAIQGFDHELEAELHRARIFVACGGSTASTFTCRRPTSSSSTAATCASSSPPTGCSKQRRTGSTLASKRSFSTNIHPCRRRSRSARLGSWRSSSAHRGATWSTGTDGRRNSHRTPRPALRWWGRRVSSAAAKPVGAASTRVARGRGLQPAAFFDALIGQQDRNKGNVLWYEERQVIYLIDHSFSFALDRRPARRAPPTLSSGGGAVESSRRLTQGELDALAGLLASSDLLTLRRFLAPERADALAARARRDGGDGRDGSRTVT